MPHISTTVPPISDQRFVLAYYGIDRSAIAAQRFFRASRAWFGELGHTPDKLGVVGKGFSGRVGAFQRPAQKLESAEMSNVRAFEMYASKPGAIVSGMQYFVSVCFANDRDGYAIVAMPSQLATPRTWMAIAKQCIQCVSPSYGIGYYRQLGMGPVTYALGLCQGFGVDLTGKAEAEARNISRWCDTGRYYRVYRDGLLRDVYPINLLTQPQMERRVGRQSLRNWIAQDTARGSLEPFAGEMHLWLVSKRQIPGVRRTLREAGAIFDWRKYL